MIYDMDLPHRIKAARTQAGMTQQTLAHNAGLAIGTVARVERGEDMAVSTLAAIATALGITLAELVA